MISQSAEYALRVVVCMAARPGIPMTTVQLAEATKVPPFYLAKLMRTMVEAGLINSRRGINGGFQLVRDPASLSLLEVVQSITPPTRLNACPSDAAGHKMCALHRRLGMCQEYTERTLSGSSIADVLNDNGTAEFCHAIAVTVSAVGLDDAAESD